MRRTDFETPEEFKSHQRKLKKLNNLKHLERKRQQAAERLNPQSQSNQSRNYDIPEDFDELSNDEKVKWCNKLMISFIPNITQIKIKELIDKESL